MCNLPLCLMLSISLLLVWCVTFLSVLCYQYLFSLSDVIKAFFSLSLCGFTVNPFDITFFQHIFIFCSMSFPFFFFLFCSISLPCFLPILQHQLTIFFFLFAVSAYHFLSSYFAVSAYLFYILQCSYHCFLLHILSASLPLLFKNIFCLLVFYFSLLILCHIYFHRGIHFAVDVLPSDVYCFP